MLFNLAKPRNLTNKYGNFFQHLLYQLYWLDNGVWLCQLYTGGYVWILKLKILEFREENELEKIVRTVLDRKKVATIFSNSFSH